MKVGIYIAGYAPHAGGGYTFEQEVLTSLDRIAPNCRHEFTLFFDTVMQTEKEDVFFSENIKSIYLNYPIKKSKLQMALTGLIKKLRSGTFAIEEGTFQELTERENIELVWFPTPIYVHTDIPYIATMWDIQHRLQPWFPEVGKLKEWTGREAHYATHLRRASYVITGTKIGSDELSFFYQISTDRLRILPLPVPTIGSLPAEDDILKTFKKYGISPNYLFYPAQFWPHKNHANLLFALQILKDTYGEEKHLVLVGSDYGNLEYIRDLARKLKLQDQVHFLGFVPREDLISLYIGAYALVFVSLFGPDNLPPLEAFKCNCPVIVSDYRGAREQYGDAPLFVNGLNPNEIAEAIYQLIREPSLRMELIEKGSRRAKIYNGTDYVQDIIKVFDDFEKVRRNWK